MILTRVCNYNYSVILTSIIISAEARERSGKSGIESGHDTRTKVEELDGGIVISQTNYNVDVRNANHTEFQSALEFRILSLDEI
jgi:hypothetical protein